jgi:hypothetical protein
MSIIPMFLCQKGFKISKKYSTVVEPFTGHASLRDISSRHPEFGFEFNFTIPDPALYPDPSLDHHPEQM